MPFEFTRLEIPDLVLIKPKIISDTRGFFTETYQRSAFHEQGITESFVQDNLSRSTYASLRGMHYQIDPSAQGKLVSCLKGDIFDVAVDIRNGSPTFGKWVGVRLTDDNRHMLYIPPGFAHGFCVLSDQADFMYKVTNEYAPACERGIIWNDPAIGIVWPITEPILSEKDTLLPELHQAEYNFSLT